jgi:hypothetical protein
MKRLLLLIVCAYALVACTAATPQSGKAWLNAPPANLDTKSALPIGSADIYEVVASKAPWALDLLKDKSSAPLTAESAPTFAGSHYVASAGMSPYLVRAVYGNGATGAYQVSRLGNDLVILHQSMGHSTPANASALVLNLDFAPQHIYTVVRVVE